MLESEHTVNLSVFHPKSAEAEKIFLPATTSPDRITLVFRTDDVHLFLGECEEAILGRSHNSNKIQPAVDLSKFGGTSCGTSRLHASLRRKDHKWWIEDLGSSNGTWVNGERLAPFTPYQLTGNNQVLLANLEVGIIVPEIASRSLAA